MLVGAFGKAAVVGIQPLDLREGPLVVLLVVVFIAGWLTRRSSAPAPARTPAADTHSAATPGAAPEKPQFKAGSKKNLSDY